MTSHPSTATTSQLSLFEEALEPRFKGRSAGMERIFDVSFVSQLALREKQIQQRYRPVIAVHKWFARRPGTLFRALLLAEFGTPPLTESFYRAHDLSGLHVADPFMGGGTPLLEANRLGCDVTGWDINPMAYWIVSQEIRHLDLGAYRRAAQAVGDHLGKELCRYYSTRCRLCQRRDALVKYFLWVKTTPCVHCNHMIDLFPGYLLAAAGRHPENVLVCSSCGQLNEVEDRNEPGPCRDCDQELILRGPAKRGRCKCPNCGEINSYPDAANGAPEHRMFALEYQCWHCKKSHRGRFFKKPDEEDLTLFQAALQRWRNCRPRFVPDDSIPRGDETNRLHRWGYRHYKEMFNERQLLGLELLSRRIARVEEPALRHALATNLSDLLRYQNLLCRYDTSALKSLDIFSVHGFPVGLVQAESNLLGMKHPGSGNNVGSGGWSNIVEKFVRAKAYCDEPFEIESSNGRKVTVPVAGEWIGEEKTVAGNIVRRKVDLRCGSATHAFLEPHSLDAVLSDPPYFANVQYAELMDFCYVWLRKLVNGDDEAFVSHSTRNTDELTGNVTMERGLEHFTEGLSDVFRRMARALKPRAPFAFTYHHNQLGAYFPIAVAILDAGLVCSAVLACPAEMGGSIHIHSTTSSIIDSIFVCRSTGSVPRETLVETPLAITRLVSGEIEQLRQGGVRVTLGDARCVAFGHIIRMAIWKLKGFWDANASWAEKLERVERSATDLGNFDEIEAELGKKLEKKRFQSTEIREPRVEYDVGEDDEVPF